MNKLILFSLFVVVALAQYFTNPTAGFPSGETDTGGTVNPCGFSLSTIQWAAPYVTSPGFNILQVEWQVSASSGLTPGNGDPVIFNLWTDPVTNNNQSTYVFNLYNLTWGQSDTSLRVPYSLSPAYYLLQMTWSDYHSCSRIQVVASNFSLQPAAPGQILSNQEQEANVWIYYDVTFSAGIELYLQLEAPIYPATKVVVGADITNNVFPTDTSGSIAELNSETGAEADSVLTTGACYNGFDTQQVTYTIGIWSEPAEAESTYTVNFGTFDEADITVPIGSRTIQPHTGFLYFYTSSYSSDISGDIRVHIQSTGDAPTTFQGATNCLFTNGVFEVSTTNVYTSGESCLDMPNQEAASVHYIEVGPMADTYTITVEQGSCSDLSGSIAVSASILLILLALLLSL